MTVLPDLAACPPGGAPLTGGGSPAVVAGRQPRPVSKVRMRT